MFKERYRIVQRKDNILNKDFFYIERQNFPWSSWVPVCNEGYTKRFCSLKTAMDEIDTFQNALYHESF